MSRATRDVLRATAAAALLLILPAPAPMGRQPPHPRVSVDVSVDMEGFGSPPRLGPDDFEVRAAGQQIPVTGVTVNKQPLRLILLLDVSASITRRIKKGVIEDHVRELFIDRLQAGEEARIGGFAGRLHLSQAFTRDRRALRRALDAALSHREESTFGPSPVWDYTYAALDALADSPGRKAVIVLTDGRATGNRRGVEEVAEHAIRVGATINVISLDRQLFIQQDAASAVVVRPRNVLLWIADVTGGLVATMVHEPREPMGPGLALERSLMDLRRVYSLEFEPPRVEGRFHKLDVLVKHASASVRAPKVYFHNSSTSGP
jgi:VWFA-related protein